jgi:hypothetical protein
MEVSDQLHYLAAVPPGKQPRYSLCGRLSEHQNRSGGYVGDNNVLPQPGIESQLLGRVARNQSLYRLLKKYEGYSENRLF